MNGYMEQTVAAKSSPISRMLYALAWVLVVLLGVGALIAAAGVMAGIEQGGFAWLDFILLLILLAAAVFVYFRKDRFRAEYDYAIRDGRLEVSAVLNNRRRRPRLRLELSRILSCGRGNYPAAPGEKIEKLYLNPDAEITFICYEENGERRRALLELNDEMIACMRACRELQFGAWRE